MKKRKDKYIKFMYYMKKKGIINTSEYVKILKKIETK